MKKFNRTALSIIALSSLSGTAFAQSTLDQGTIDRQRNRLDHSSIASATNGWLNDSQTPRFWAWELNASVNDTYKHSNMQRWIQYLLWSSSISGGSINTTSLDQQAQQIADEIVNRYNSTGNDAIADGEYAVCLLNIRSLDLHDHPSDDLDDSVTLWNPKDVPANAIAEPWANFVTSSETPARASVWRSNGVALADAAIEYLTDEVVSRVETQIPSFPAPIRLFFDEERGRQHGSNSLDNLGAIEAVITDNARRSTESLYGNYDLWDSTPTTTVAMEVFTSQPIADILADMAGWNTASLVYRPDNHTPIPQYSASNYAHQRPHFDYEFYPMYNHYNGILETSNDGAIGAAIDHPLTDPNWGNPKWSNYSTSVYFSTSYPKTSHSKQGVLNADWPPHRGYGWTQTAHLGSGSIQSPVLYPPSNFHEDELESDFHPDPGIVINTQGEKAARAWVRYSRMQLDHTIFSFEELDSLGISAPRHIAPWVTRVGTVVYRPTVENDFNITTKDNVRDIVALCKAKGVNEILFWGDPNSSANALQCDESSSTAQYGWDATNDLLSQVYGYTLRDVWFNNAWIGASSTKSMEFSEEHTHDFVPATSPSSTSVSFVAEFDTDSITTPGDSYTFVTEVLDGGGPWANAAYTLEIYNYKSQSYQSISDPRVERYSNSTRRAEFTDSDADSYANDWSRTFDDQSVLPIDSTVYDRKRINAWEDFTLPIGSGFSITNYMDTASKRMKLRVTVSHSAPLGLGLTADELRVDMVQLYETECANNNITAAPQPILGDMNNDQQVDASDLIQYMQAFVSNPTMELDLNHDGQVDFNDIQVINKLTKSN